MLMKISGKIKKNHAKAIQFFADRLLSKQMQRNVDISVVMTKKADHFGEIEILEYDMRDNPRSFALIVKKDLCEKETLKTLSHEMVHVKQYVYKELNDEMTIWKGKEFIEENCDYYNLPWEKEAHELGDKLYEEYIENELSSKL